jgi:hypothetical protein
VEAVKSGKKISCHGNSIPKVQSRSYPSKPFSFANALKNSAPKPSFTLIRGRRSKKEKVAHGVGKNNRLESEEFTPFGPHWKSRGVRESLRQ